MEAGKKPSEAGVPLGLAVCALKRCLGRELLEAESKGVDSDDVYIFGSIADKKKLPFSLHIPPHF